MRNFKEDILDELASNGDTEAAIEGVRITELLCYWRSAEEPRNAGIEEGVLYPWSYIGPKLDYPYQTGYGSSDCHMLNLWTANYIYYIEEYDGATSVMSIPRHPTGKEHAKSNT